MYSSTVQACEHDAIAFDRSSQDYYWQRAKKVDADISKRGKMCFETASWKWSHKGWRWLTATELAGEAIADYPIDGGPRMEDVIFFLKCVKRRLCCCMDKEFVHVGDDHY
jgi:hypothetical protein